MVAGGLAIGVPGELRAYEYAYKRFGGGVSWKALFQPTIDLCRNGYVVSAALGSAIQSSAKAIMNDPGLKYVRASKISRECMSV